MNDGNAELNVVGDPLLDAVARIGNFRISADVRPQIYTAASHRRIIRSLRVENIGWSGVADEVVLSVHSEAPGTTGLVQPWARAYPSIAKGDWLVDESVEVIPNLVQLAGLEEAVSGHIVLRVLVEGQVLAEERIPVDFLAHNQWMHTRLDYEMIAAFVSPNHPVVSRIMDGVRTRLGANTGSGTTEGYQRFGPTPEAFMRGLNRVDDMLRAIFEELQQQGYEYSDPPASFEGYGQKIRTPDVIDWDRAVTCLDSAVLSASCIAAAGLSPIVFVVQGHAFPAAWHTPANFVADNGAIRNEMMRPSVIDNINDFQMLVSKGLIISFESTNICRSLKVPYDEARNRHLDFAEGDGADEFRAMIDVERAFQGGVRRLPSRTHLDGGLLDVVVDRSGLDVKRPDGYETVHPTDSSDRTTRNLDGDIPVRVRRWMDALLDVSNTNALINLQSTPAYLPDKKRSPRRSVEIPMVPGLLGRIEDRLMAGEPIRAVCAHRMDQMVLRQPNNETVNDYFDSTATVSIGPVGNFVREIEIQTRLRVDDGIPPGAANSDAIATLETLHEAEVTRRFRSLQKLADDVEAESATNQLFLTLGTLVWESAGATGREMRQLRSPLYMIPIRITGTAKTSYRIAMEESGDISPNYCLMEKLRSELGLKLDVLEKPTEDESGIDIDDAIETIRRQLGSSRFASMRVEDTCSLAVLDFATFRMWKDIQANWRAFTQNVVVNHLVNGMNETLLQDVEPFLGQPLTPFECDESQVEAVRWALEGRSFVLEGPPGTGKSQTIANMIAASMAEGKRVLFVAEKQVALDAVARKLEDIGLDPFCITMHHESTTPESIRKQLRESLDFVGQDLSAQWSAENTVSDALRERLVQYRDGIVGVNSIGQSAIVANQEVIRLGDGPGLDIAPSTLRAIGERLTEVRSALLQIRGVAGVSRLSIEPAWTIAAQGNPESLQREHLAAAIGALRKSLEDHGHLRPLIEPLLGTSSDGMLDGAVVTALGLFAEGRGLSPATVQEVSDPAWIARLDDLSRQADSVADSYKSVLAFFTTDAFTMDLGVQMNAANEAIGSGLFGRKRREETLRNLVAPIARVPVTQEPAEILTLLQRVAPARDALDALKSSYRAVPHLQVRIDFDPLDTNHRNELMDQARDLVGRAAIQSDQRAADVRRLVESGVSIGATTKSEVELVVATWARVRDAFGVTAESEARWTAGRTVWESIKSSIDTWAADAPNFQSLVRYLLVHETLKPLIAAGQDRLATDILEGRLALDDLYDQFERGVARASRGERLGSGPLATFDRTIFDRTVADFARHDLVRRGLMRTVIPRNLAESRGFKAGVRVGEIGNLERELVRKVRRVSIPKLIREYGEVITRLTPCFLMSPEAVSRLLPAGSQLFDIVVFDEASQVRVAAAIPAMGRAKSVVVVGDSQQMPPSRNPGRAQTSAESDAGTGDDDVYVDMESILTECTESHLPSLMLKCHFRSQHEGLISFSNRKFYEGRLVTFPAPNTDRTSPVSWFEIPDGQFLRSGEGKGTNPAEATAVVNEIQRRLNSPEHSSKTIGVVTFNEQQAGLIREKLDEIAASDSNVAAAMNLRKRSERLFVVPLERVQGDERDTIMLSVSYSYQDGSRTKVSPTWGPLTNKGGERRLNVAITRAKKDLLVFCSFDPNHVTVDSSTYKGVPDTVEFLKECREAARGNTAVLHSRDASVLDHHRRRIFEELRTAGHAVRENVGLSRFRIDLAVSGADGDPQFLAILLDGEDWAGRSTPFDRDVLPDTVLKLIGWRRVARVWLKSVIEDPTFVARTVASEISRERTRRDLVGALEAHGYEVRDDSALARIGVDLAVRRAGHVRWALGVCLNGPELFAQLLPYEGETPPAKFLEEVGCIEAISAWIPDLDPGFARLVARVDEVVDRIVSTNEMGTPPSPPEPVHAGPATSAPAVPPTGPVPLLAGSEYRIEFVDARGLPALGEQAALGPGVGARPDLVRLAIEEVVEAEGPIIESRLASIVVGRFGMSKVKAARLESLRGEFRRLTSTVSPFGPVYWSTSRSAGTWTGYRTSTGEVVRTIDEVPAEEIANAMVDVVRMGGTAFADQIVRHVAEAFGRRQVTKQLTESLGAILDWATSNGRLTVSDGLYKMPE